MNHSLIAVRYAKALFKLAKEKGLEDQIHQDMKKVNEAISISDDLDQFLMSPIQRPSKKKEILISLYNKSIHEISYSFLNLIVDKKRENFIQQIIRDYDTFYKQDKKIKDVIFQTAVKIDSNSIPQIKKLIEEALGCDIDLTLKEDSKMIGGFLIAVDGKLMDASISHKLKEIKKQLLS